MWLQVVFSRFAQFIQDAAKAKQMIMLHISFLSAPAFGVLLLLVGFILPWNTLTFDLNSDKKAFLLLNTL